MTRRQFLSGCVVLVAAWVAGLRKVDLRALLAKAFTSDSSTPYITSLGVDSTMWRVGEPITLTFSSDRPPVVGRITRVGRGVLDVEWARA